MSKFKSFRDWILYLIILSKKQTIILALNFSIFFFSLFTIWSSVKNGIESNWSFSVVLILSLLILVWNIYERYEEIHRIISINEHIQLRNTKQILTANGPVSMNVLEVSSKENLFAFNKIMATQQEVLLTSNKLNNNLWSKDWNIEINTTKLKDIRASLIKKRTLSAAVLTYKYLDSRNKGQVFLNENKFCLTEDINLSKDTVLCHKGTYFDSFLTNEFSSHLFVDTDSNQVVDGGNGSVNFPAFTNDKNQLILKDITQSDMNNHVGVSTLAITKDYYLVLWMQTQRVQHNQDKLVPTGSGSCDWKDFTSSSLQKTLVSAMKRELWEEASLGKKYSNVNEIGETKLLGFYRWVRRGGKPEFTGLTQLECYFSELSPSISEVRRTGEYNIDGPEGENSWYVPTLSELNNTLERLSNKERISIPLFMCIDSLKLAIRDRPEEIKEFLRMN